MEKKVAMLCLTLPPYVEKLSPATARFKLHKKLHNTPAFQCKVTAVVLNVKCHRQIRAHERFVPPTTLEGCGLLESGASLEVRS